ncbi:unnamed protein product [Caenorhabditis angaria]|uniref:Uncharacterized protein n=1 Tax=Caenorhabditis angaria TaxID=860376 RepID=A0A9P1I9B6_9PELO|nr:unnamed protein product [Caenorhabditis angaria]
MSNNEEDNNETRFLGDLLSNANTPTDSTSSPEEMQQRQIYSKGFFDALRAIQNVNNFEFRPATSPVIPPLGTPGTGQSAITPATANDMQQIMLSLLGTPIVGSTQTSTNSTNPPQLLASPTGSLSLDSDMLKLYASAVLPGPPILPLPSPTITKSTTNIEPPAVTTTVPSVAVTAAASTSRPDKLNLPPVAQQIPKMEQYQNLSSDDSDSGYTRSSSRNANSKE